MRKKERREKRQQERPEAPGGLAADESDNFQSWRESLVDLTDAMHVAADEGNLDIQLCMPVDKDSAHDNEDGQRTHNEDGGDNNERRSPLMKLLLCSFSPIID